MEQPVEIVTSGLVAGDKVPLVGLDLAGEPACHGPGGACIERIQQDRMGHQAGDTPVAVDEWVYPQQAMMGVGRGEDRIGGSQAMVGRLEPREEARHGASADGDVAADRHLAGTPGAGRYGDLLPALRVLD